MAAVTAILGSIVVVGGAIRDLINNGYRLPQVLKDLETRLATLTVEKQTLEAEIGRVGLTEDQGLKDLLGSALSNLEELKTRLEAKKPKGGGNPCGGCLPYLKWSFFPAELQEIVNRVTQIFDNVLDSLKKQIEFKEVLQKRVLANLPSLQCRPDLRYIRLENTCEKVMVALRNSNGPSMVLLHGGPGTGKSSLATDVAVQFQEDIVNRRALCDPQASNSSSVFNEVIFLECGPQMDPQVKQSELREKLGWSTSGDGLAHATSDSDNTITKTLSHLLKDRKLLVILDDVWKSGLKFLQLMIDIGGKNVKWLITSQLQGLCSDLNCKSVPISISMEEVALHNARRILAVHIGLPETVISEVQDFMDPLIHKVNGNLLALTCIAPAIEPTRYNQKREWARLEKELSELLDSMPESKFFQSKEYGRSYWEAVQVGFDFLSTRQQNLIILMYMCRGPSTREGIIEYLFEHTNDRHQNFSQARRELQGRGLIKLSNVNDSEEGEENTCSWSIHFLLKEFIKRKYFLGTDGSKLKTLEVLSDRSILFDNQMRCPQESDVLIAMVALYFQKEFAEELVSKNSAQVDIPRYTVQLVDSRDHVIEPVAQLLIRSEDTDWSSALRSATQQVFLEFSRRGVFDQDGTSTLLAATVSRACMLTALSRYHQIEPHSFFGHTVVSSLVQLLETELISAVSADASSVSSLGALSLVRRIAYELGDQLVMDGTKIDDNDKLHLSKIVEQLRDGLAKSALYDLQVSSAEVLASLLFDNNHISKKVVATSGLLEGLVTAIEDDGRKAFQRASAHAIANLACNSTYIKLKIVSCNGTLEALVAGLKKEEDETLRYSCVLALHNLAGNSSRIGLEIVNCSGALEALATGLNKEKSRMFGKSIAVWSGRTFGYLAQTSSEAKWKIVKLRGVLEYFVSAVARVYQDGTAQNNVIISDSARALWRLAAGGDPIRAEMMDSCPGILHALTDAVTSLWNGGPKETEDDRGCILRDTMYALTLLDPGRAKEMHIDSGYVYWGRGCGMLTLGHYQEAVKDFDRCEALLQGSLRQNKEFGYFLSCRGCAKAKASDFQNALADLNLRVEINRDSTSLQERGVAKRMMGDLQGALADLDEGLCLEPIDFEMLKHRGFVKYLLHDEEGAQIDAQQALQVRKEYGDCIDYNSNYLNCVLGLSIVTYLDFQL